MTQQTKGRKPGATSGYLTVYVALTLTVMVSLCLVLIEGVRGGNPRITVEKPLVVYERENVYTDEVRRLYYD